MDKIDIDKKAFELVIKEEMALKDIYNKIENLAFVNSAKVLTAMQKENIMETDLLGTTGYGYNDLGRDKIEWVFARVLGAEDALVRCQIISGTHALTTALFGILRPGDTMLCITGTPYDTIHEVIGIKDNNSSLQSFGVYYEQIELLNDDFDYSLIKASLEDRKVKMVYIQRSRGYSDRKSITIDKVKEVCDFIKKIDQDVIIMVDNCYTEFVENLTPVEVGADLIAGSLIKNLGGGIAPNGGYIAGRKDLVALAAERLNVPGQGKEVGPSGDFNRHVLMGLYMAPNAVASSVKMAILTSKVLERLGYDVDPKYDEVRADIVQTIKFGNEQDLLSYVRGIQKASAIDSSATVMPTDMPGYDDKIIMASGSFTQGSSIELSCDGPIRMPYIAYQQGSLTYEYGRLALMLAIGKLI